MITITGCAAAGAFVGRGSLEAGTLVRWRGTVIGANASISIAHPSERTARRLIERCLDEVHRLESLFSLHVPNSKLVQLNRVGVLERPPLDFYRLLAECRRFHIATGGLFDPSVQPLWRLYADHFAAGGGLDGPRNDAVEAARAGVDFSAISIAPQAIAFQRPSMALTLNGIAQGYITDRVADMLRDGGVADTLVSLGEVRGIGRHPNGRLWRVGLAVGRDDALLSETVELSKGAVATSAGSGTVFEPSGRFHHLLNPRSGAVAHYTRSVTVFAPRATIADAVSTALAVVEPGRAREILRATGAERAVITLPTGIRREVVADRT